VGTKQKQWKENVMLDETRRVRKDMVRWQSTAHLYKTGAELNKNQDEEIKTENIIDYAG
jgi:hypothetical protein